ncbi:MAG: A24 family peptidase [Lachnospiraceae bacterium]|nr:A24 family peptidase [Lachnospiraceae bacterium]
MWSEGLLCVILAGAGWTDLRFGKVSNRWLLLGALAGVCCRGPDFGWSALALLIPAFVLFRFRMMGAGDGKLMGVIAGYLGVEAGVQAVAAGLAVGAIWSLCRLWCSQGFRARFWYLSAYFMRFFRKKKIEAYDTFAGPDQENRIPLAACLAVGGYLYLAGQACLERGIL